MWETLKKGDKIDVIAPASGSSMVYEFIPRDAILPYLSPYELSIPEDLFKETPFVANSDEYRLKSLIDALQSDSKAIWCSMGGYGCTRLIPQLQKMPAPLQEKIFIGYSDITALNLFMNKFWGWKTIHGPGLVNNNNKDISNFQLIAGVINGSITSVKIPISKQLNDVNGDNIEGELIGGCLSLIQASIGTSWQISTKDKIVYLEDVHEAGYRVDRMLEHLVQADFFNDAAAVVFGEFLEKEPTDVMAALERFAKDAAFPVYKSEAFGHGKFNYPIINGALGQIEQEEGEIYLEYQVPQLNCMAE